MYSSCTTMTDTIAKDLKYVAHPLALELLSPNTMMAAHIWNILLNYSTTSLFTTEAPPGMN